MAIYHLRVKVTGRKIENPKPGGAQRRSAVAAAAYRSGDRLFDASQGKWCQRTPDADHKVEHTAILAPDDAPAWVYDRAALWNAVERGEMNQDGSLRENAQLYREVEITLPRELSADERISLVEKFATEHFVSEGMVADIAIHNKRGSDGLPQPHAHIMLTMRRLDANRPSGFAKAKERDWNIPPALDTAIRQAKAAVGVLEKRAKTGALIAEDADQLAERKQALQNLVERMPVSQWRAAWAKAANAALAQAGSHERIDHRTLVAQREEALAMGDFVRAAALNREPQKPMGIAGRVQDLYRYMKDRISTWVAIAQRRNMTRYLERLQARDPTKTLSLLLRLNEWAQDTTDRFNRSDPERDLIPEAPYER